MDNLLPHTRFGWTLWLLCVLVGGTAWTAAVRVRPEDATPGGLPAIARVGFAAPDFTASTLTAERVTLSALRGKPVVVNFWATWCPPCRQELPHLKAAAAAYGDRVTFLGVDDGEPPDLVADFARREGLDNYPIVLNPDSSIAIAWRVNALPTTFFIDAEGVIREMYTGPLTRAAIDEKLSALLPQN